MSKYHIVSVDKEGVARVGKGTLEHKTLIDALLLVKLELAYEKTGTEIFICEV